jgi:hypothetical protein
MKIGGDGGMSWLEAGKPSILLDGVEMSVTDMVSADDMEGTVVMLDTSKMINVADCRAYNWFALGLEKASDEERWAAITIVKRGKVEFVREAI